MKMLLIYLILAVMPGRSAKAEELPLTLDDSLTQALARNPEIAASAARAQAEHSAARSQAWLDNPRFGLMRESNLNFMQQQMGPMTLWSVTQEIKFPVKYFLLGSAQSARARGADAGTSAKRLEIRQKVITAYFNVFTAHRILALLESQRQTLREVARAAESRHATGAVPQQDEMKAHVEQTKLESEILLVQEEREAAEAALNASLNRDAHDPVRLPSQELPVPGLKAAPESIPALAERNAATLRQSRHLLDESNTRKSLANLSYAPDFMVSYRHAFVNAPANAYAASIEMSVPLWFFARQYGDVAQARAEQLEAERNLEKTRRALQSDVRSLTTKVRSHEKLLEIYQTALVPQATSTLNSSRAAYQAGRSSFLELLDSERSLYETRIAYYRRLSEYVETLTRLEELVGASLSTLPFGDQS